MRRRPFGRATSIRQSGGGLASIGFACDVETSVGTVTGANDTEPEGPSLPVRYCRRQVVKRPANAVPPSCGCYLTVANKAFFHNAQFVIIRPMPAAFTIGSRQNFDLRAIDKVGHKVGLTIRSSPRSDGRRRRFTFRPLSACKEISRWHSPQRRVGEGSEGRRQRSLARGSCGSPENSPPIQLP
jgi:hypothetical protein